METSCVMPGNVPPCAYVSLGEVIDAINQWVNGYISLQEAIELINSWADPVAYLPF
jgi:hypothetical protein